MASRDVRKILQMILHVLTFRDTAPNSTEYWSFPLWNRNSLNAANSGKLINHLTITWAQFKDHLSHMCLAGAVVACWSLTQEVPELHVYCNDKYFFH